MIKPKHQTNKQKKKKQKKKNMYRSRDQITIKYNTYIPDMYSTEKSKWPSAQRLY